jgi:hypothetical protein
MLWQSVPWTHWAVWAAFMAVGAVASLIAKRFTQFGDDRPMTRGFGKEISFGRAVAELLRFPAMILLLAAILALWATRIYIGGWVWRDALAIAVAAVAYPFGEWWFHTRISHSMPIHFLGGMRIHSVFSRYHHSHHRDPYARDLAVSPMVTFIQYLFIPTGLAYLFLRAPVSLSFAAMLLTMIFRYEAFHFFFHAPYKPRSRWFRRLRDHHLWHHFQNEDYWFCVTDPYGDRLLGTNPSPKDVPRSPTCRNIGSADPAPVPTADN